MASISNVQLFPLVVEAEELRLAKGLEELPDEERIAAGLLGHQAGQRLGGLEVAMQGVANQAREIGRA